MIQPEVILDLSDEVESFIDLQSSVENDIIEITVTNTYDDGLEVEENIDEVLIAFGAHFIDSFVELFINDGILDEDIPAEGKKNIEKRKGVKYVLDQLKAISTSAKGEEW